MWWNGKDVLADYFPIIACRELFLFAINHSNVPTITFTFLAFADTL